MNSILHVRDVFFNRLGELRDRSFENQRYRASGLNLVTAAIVLWNTVYLERAIQAIKIVARPSMKSSCSTCRLWAGEHCARLFNRQFRDEARQPLELAIGM